MAAGLGEEDEDGPVATLAHNASGLFQDRWVRLLAFPESCPFLRGIETMEVPIAHGEGRFVCRSDWELQGLLQTGRAVLRYADNPNGSQGDIAGLCDVTGRVLGLIGGPGSGMTRLALTLLAAGGGMAAVVDVFLSSGGKTAGVVGAQDVLDLKNSELTGALRTEIRHHTQRAFRSEGATPRSVISFEEPFESWRQTLSRQAKYLSMQAVNAAGWLAILIVINRLAILAGLDDVVRLPIKKVSAFLGAALQWLKTVLALMFGH